MTAYRSRPPGALDLAPPAPDAAWYEQLAHQLVLYHQPAPAPAERPRGPTPLQIVSFVAKYYLPRCASCRREVESVAIIQDASTRTIVVTAFCHGAAEDFEIDERAIMARAGDRDALVDFLRDELRRKVFTP